MSDDNGNGVKEKLGEHHADIRSLKEDMGELKGDVKAIRSMLDQQKGGYFALSAAGAIGGGITALAFKVLPLIGMGPK